MNCPACGHPADEHDGHGCYHRDPAKRCMCKAKGHKLLKIERDDWRDEALAAREFIIAVHKKLEYRWHLSFDADETALWQAYLAARVPDEPKETP